MMVKRLFSLVLAAMLAVCLMAPSGVMAAGVEPPVELPSDQDSKCSLTVCFAPGKTPVPNVNFRLFKVADVDVDKGTYYPLEGYDDGVLESKDEWSKKAQILAEYVKLNHQTETVSEKTDKNGIACFPDLDPGIYLVIGATGVVGNTEYTPTPSFITLPAFDRSTSKWALMDLFVNVKSYMSGTVSNPPVVDPDTDTKIMRSVLKKWEDEGNEDARPEQVVVNLLQDGEPYKTVVLSAANNWRYTWEDLPSGHEYVPVEQEGGEGYQVSITLKGSVFVVTNTYVPDTEGSEPDGPGELETPDVPYLLRRSSKAAPKAASEPVVDSSGKFGFDVVLTAANGAALAGTYPVLKPPGTVIGKVVDGKGSFRLNAGETFLIPGMPEGASYKVTEQKTPGWDTSGKYNDEGTVGGEAVTFVNKANGEPEEPPVGSPSVGGFKIVDHTGGSPGIQVTELVEDWTDESSKWIPEAGRSFQVRAKAFKADGSAVKIPYDSDGSVSGEYDEASGEWTFSMSDGNWLVLRPEGLDVAKVEVRQDSPGDELGPYYGTGFHGDCAASGTELAATVEWDGSSKYVAVRNEVLPRAPFKFFKVDSEGQGLSGAGFDLTSGGKTVASSSSGEGGSVSFEDIYLPEGTYKLKETYVPDGYNLETDLYDVVVDSSWVETSDGRWFLRGRSSMYAPGDTGHETPIVQFTDSPGLSLPSTGGAGAGPYYVAGFVLAAVAAAWFVLAGRDGRRRALALLLCAVLAGAMAVPAEASGLPAESYAVLNVRYAPDGTPVNSMEGAVIEFKAYKVADVVRNNDGSYAYTLTEQFQSSGIDVDATMSWTQISDGSVETQRALLNRFGTFLSESGGAVEPAATAVTKTVRVGVVPEIGIAQLTGLSDGLYLVTTQALTTIGSTVYTAVPFLVNIPYEANGVSNNYMTATVKFTTHTSGDPGPGPGPGPGPDNPGPDIPDAPDVNPLDVAALYGARAAQRSADAGPSFRFELELFTEDGAGNETSLADGEYPVIAEGGSVIGTVSGGKASFEVPENGAWRVLNLPEGVSYRVTEGPADGWTVRSQFGVEGSADEGAGSPAMVVNVADPGGFALPKTGGMGTAPYAVLGSAAVLLSALLLLRRKRYR